MLAPSPAGFRRLWPLLKPHRRRLLAGGACMLVFVACWPLLAALAGKSGEVVRVGFQSMYIQIIEGYFIRAAGFMRLNFIVTDHRARHRELEHEGIRASGPSSCAGVYFGAR